MTTKCMSVYIVEDEPVTRKALRFFLGKHSADIEVIGEAETAELGVQQIQKLRPSIALLDIGLPGMNGIDAANRIKAMSPDTKVLMLTNYEDEASILAAFNAGADGYVFKAGFRDSLDLAMRTVKIGAVWLDPRIAQQILNLAIKKGDHGLTNLSPQDRNKLEEVAHATCEDGVCLVEPTFLQKLQRIKPLRA
ncbi:MAG: response regulator transcription factor [Candidatus Obscuribacterales bacterium]|nr:response regulator transcription factor [Candidatus Obscuribacterales bacterium]